MKGVSNGHWLSCPITLPLYCTSDLPGRKILKLFAHSVPGRGEEDWEPLDVHLAAVAAAAKANASFMGADSVAELAGWLHDLGKVKPGFQDKLRGRPNDTAHSGEGARYAIHNVEGVIAKLVAFCVAGHHSGLPNGLIRSESRPATPLRERLDQSEDVALPQNVILPELSVPHPLKGLSGAPFFEMQFFTRMLFSALVDADFVETERFYAPDTERSRTAGLAHLSNALTCHLTGLSNVETPLNRLRAEILAAAGERALLPPGMFSLSVPTGGGKTLSSLRFALDHAQAHDLRRVIYVAPFTAIIEQTAAVFREALQDDGAVLEHHSAFDAEEIADEDEAERLKLAAQNWDRPIIVTTAVQFYESLFGNRTQKCRKLHNIARSVIVLDEAQSLPVAYLRPCLAALKELTRGYGCSVVLCTATQPAISDADGLNAPEAIPKSQTREIAPDPERLHAQLKRVEVHRVGVTSNAELAARIAGRKALAIVNNKRQARALHDLFDAHTALHLSTNMTVRHRQEVMARIKSGFEGPVIATALVEAGVDLDFPEVWRAVAGLDSIVQAAGRCNREGHLNKGKVFVFEPEDGFPPPPELKLNADIAREVLRTHPDPLHPDAVRAYFQRLYWDRAADLDSRRIMQKIADGKMDFLFADIAADFHLIEDATRPLIIGAGPYGLDREASELLEHGLHAGAIARAVQKFAVSVSPHLRDELIRLGAARIIRPEDFADQFVMLSNDRLYDAAAGFSPENPEDLGDLIA